MSGNWFEETDSYIQANVDDYIAHFFANYNVDAYNSGFHVSPCPFCQHNGCLSVTRNRGARCHSCSETGSKITILEKMHGKDKARKMLSDWSGIKYEPKEFTPEQREAFIAQQRIDEIYEHAIDWYHEQLMNSNLPLGVQTGTNIEAGERGHTEEMLRTFCIGYSGNFQEFRSKMLKEGYSRQELEQANEMIWLPDRKFVYPHFDEKGKLVRITTKPFIRHCLGDKGPDGKRLKNCHWRIQKKGKAADKRIKEHEEETGHKVESAIHATGGTKIGKFFFIPQKLRTAKYAILVEGEDDVVSTEEALVKLPRNMGQLYIAIGLGGNPPIENLSHPLLRRFEKIFEAFDHDDAGAGYRDLMNEHVPDIPLYTIPFDADYKDIDKFLKVSPVHEQQLEEMLDHKKALFVDTDNYLIKQVEPRVWALKNRKFTLSFRVEKIGKSNGGMDLSGELTISVGNKVQLIKNGFLAMIKLEQIYRPMFYDLIKHINEYYHAVSWKDGDIETPVRSFEELVEILRYTKRPEVVRKQIAYYWYDADINDRKQEADYIFQRLAYSYDQDEISKISQEVTGYKNQTALDIHSGFPYMQLSAFFHCRNDDAFFYYTKTVKDGDNPPKAVPYLLSNRKDEIRLDLIKRSDPQHYLLVHQRYALKQEVPRPPFDPFEVSLQPYWVEKWVNNELSDRDIDPSVLIDEIDRFIQRCYYLDAPSRKTLAIWIYSTYFYPLFDSGFPYLMINGLKGTGKSTLDMILSLLSLNAKLASSITAAALFRIVDAQGGVLILDEMENMFDRKQTESNDLAAVLKSGYSIGNAVYRTDPETNEPRRYETFCPKVISNINSVEDVLADRCLFIMTKLAPEDAVKDLEKPQKFLKEYRHEVHNITSRCAISALVHFQKVNAIFQDADTTLQTGNIRFGQIMKPLVAMARFVGGDYEENLMTFYKELKIVRDSINSGTIDGMIKHLLQTIAEELTDPQKPKWATNYTENNLYDKTISYEKTTGVFEVDSMHLKLLLEELAGGEQEIWFPEIHKAIKPMLGTVMEAKEKTRQTTITLRNEDLIKRFKRPRVKGNKYYLNVNDYLEQESVEKEAEEVLF